MKIYIAQKSFSLIELTVTLAIITIILTLSTFGINALRENYVMNSATQTLFDSLSLARSYAQNNFTTVVQGAVDVPDAFVIGKPDSTASYFQMISCKLPNFSVLNPPSGSFSVNFSPSASSGYRCNTTPPVVDANIFNSSNDTGDSPITISSNSVASLPPCSMVMFVRQTGEIYTSTTTGAASYEFSKTDCSITVISPNNTYSQTIAIYPSINVFKKI